MTDILTNIDIVTPSDWTPENSIIKVIGVGGGGCNAVTYMYNQHIQGCSFIVCNTDSQALQSSNVPTKISLGDGLGAGTKPGKARNAALESQDVIAEKVLDCGTKMLFITAGLGGGTGTGASPVIAKMAKDRGILTVGVVTIPFEEEGRQALAKASDGIHELEKNVDSLLIINNQKLYEYFGKMLLQDAWPKADEVLATAVRGIIEIKKPGYINVDFQDVITMMKNSGMALMGCGTGTGKDRIKNAVKEALESPLLNDFDLKTAKNLLINITVGKTNEGLTMEDLGEISKLISSYTGTVDKSKRGLIWDDNPECGDTIHITIIATGFQADISQLTGNDFGKLIIINKDTVFDDDYRTRIGEVPQPDEAVINKIGYNTIENVPHFHFDSKPALVVTSRTDMSQIENVAAIRRCTRKVVEDKGY